MSDLVVRGLRYRAWGPFDLHVAAGGCVALTGPSGAGKSLLLRALADLDPHEGEISLGDARQADTDAPHWRSMVSMLPAESAWWYDLVGDHFPRTTSANVSRWIVMLGFDEDVLSWPVTRLSTGERQRLALARMLARSPRALLLDEPTASLDANSVARVESLVEAYARERSAPVLWVSHDLEQCRRVATYIVHLAENRLVELTQ